MNVTKKVLAILLSMVMLLCSLSISAFATSEEIATYQNEDKDMIEIGDYDYSCNYNVGDVIEFGTYKQSAIKNENGETIGFNVEPLRWRILKIENGKALLFTEEVIDNKYYNSTSATVNGYYGNNYAHSDIREWLINDFYNTAFSSAEKTCIVATTLDNSAAPTSYNASGSYTKYSSESTTDKVFLLSKDEANTYASKYFRTTATDYAISLGYQLYSGAGSVVGDNWTLRTAGNNTYQIYTVHVRWGEHVTYFNWYDDTITTPRGVRPAIYVDLENYDETHQVDEDTDGDGLSDSWEKYGADINGDGLVDVDLPAMGADPNVPDIFVEVDWMVRPQKKFIFWETQSYRNLAPSSNAMYMVFQAFKAHNINIHIDAGENSIDFVTGKKWGYLSQGNQIEYVKSFDLDNWGTTVQENFTNERSYIFRHCIFVDQYNNTTSSGIANGIPGQYFIVANQDWVFEGGDTSVAGTFMHELGHTLGLKHGGCDHVHYKPNYLSIMNYLFQTTGLAGTGSIDYSNYKLPDIDENCINEGLGVDPYGVTAGSGLGTKWYYNGKQFSVDSIANSVIDFNNDGNIENNIKLDLNNNSESILYGEHNDWENLIYKAGNLGGAFSQGEEYYNTGNTYVYEKTLEESLITNTLANIGDGNVDCVVNTLIVGIDTQPLFFDVYNRTSNETIYTVELQCPNLFEIFSDNITVQGSVDKLESSRITIYPYSNIQVGDYTANCKLKYNGEIVFEESFTISVSKMTSQDEVKIMAAINNGELDDSGIDSSVVSIIKDNFQIEHTHNYSEWIEVDETNHKHTCECGYEENASHVWNDGEITKQPTHMEYGERTYTCRDCGATEIEQIDKTTEHAYGNWIKVDDTTHKHICECGEYEPENHIFGDWVITKEATESEVGSKEKSCVCGYTMTEEIPQKVVETKPSASSTESGDSNESESSDTIDGNNDVGILDLPENIPQETIIIVGASIGIIFLVVICVIVKKKRR